MGDSTDSDADAPGNGASLLDAGDGAFGPVGPVGLDGGGAGPTPGPVGTGVGDAAFVSGPFAGPAACVTCHDGLVDAAGQDVSIVQHFNPTMMANAARDPFWQAKLRSELKRAPGAADLLNDKCSTCHAPMANHEAHRLGTPLEVFGTGFLHEGNTLHDPAVAGVSCTLCHQIEDDGNLGSLSRTSGQYTIGLQGRIYGPYQNISGMPMLNNTGFMPTFGAHTKSSALCASCHDLRTPVLDVQGNPVAGADPFPEQMPYTEWLASDFKGKQSCQDCHMRRADGVIMASRPPWLSTKRDGFALHGFVGGNRLMLEILRDHRDELGVPPEADFAPVLSGTEALIGVAAGLQVDDASLVGGELVLAVQVTNLAGHKLPTSFPSRRVVVHLVVRDSGGLVRFESGRVDSRGRIAGVDGTDPLTFEPHHEVIRMESQAQVYEAVMGDLQGNRTYGLLQAARYLKDNRILPKGADKTALSPDIQVAGAADADADFIGGQDTVRYRVGGLDVDAVDVTVELLYQTLGYGFAQDLFTDRDDLAVARFERMFEGADSKTLSLAQTTIRVER